MITLKNTIQGWYLPIQVQLKHLALTYRFNGLARELMTDAHVAVNPIFPGLNYNPIAVKAIWDTGASNCVITSNIIKQLKLPATGQVNTQGVHGSKVVNTYIVDIILPNKVKFEKVTVTEGSIGGGPIDLLIGMDIITTGDFSVTSTNKKTTLSFRYPSVKEIDYVPEADKYNLKMTPGLNRHQRRKLEKKGKKKK